MSLTRPCIPNSLLSPHKGLHYLLFSDTPGTVSPEEAPELAEAGEEWVR